MNDGPCPVGHAQNPAYGLLHVLPLSPGTVRMEGSLHRTPVWELAAACMHLNRTGLLTLEHGEQRRILYFQQGRIVFARSNDPDERLGETLLCSGRLSYSAFLAASREIRPGRRLGAILVEKRLLTPVELIEAVVHQVERIVIRTFTWTQGRWSFEPTDGVPQEVVTLAIPMPQLLYTAIRQIPSWSPVQHGIAGLRAVFQWSQIPPPDPISLEPDEWSLLHFLRQPRTVEFIGHHSRLPDFDTCRFLVAMMAIGTVRRLDPPWDPKQILSASMPYTSTEAWVSDTDTPEFSFHELAELMDREEVRGRPPQDFLQTHRPDQIVLSLRCRHRYLWHWMVRMLGPERARQELQAILDDLYHRQSWLWEEVTPAPDGELDWPCLTRNLMMYGPLHGDKVEDLIERELNVLRRCMSPEALHRIRVSLDRIAAATRMGGESHGGQKGRL